MGSPDPFEDGAPVRSASEGAPRPTRSNEEWWPLWVAPWGATLAVTVMVIAQTRRSGADQMGPAMLASMVGMIVGLIVYGRVIKMVSPRWHPRLRRGLAVISTAVAFVGLTAYFGGFLAAAWGDGSAEPLLFLKPQEFIGLGVLTCFGWAPILLVVALFAHLAGGGEARDASAAQPDATGP